MVMKMIKIQFASLPFSLPCFGKLNFFQFASLPLSLPVYGKLMANWRAIKLFSLPVCQCLTLANWQTKMVGVKNAAL